MIRTAHVPTVQALVTPQDERGIEGDAPTSISLPLGGVQ